MNSALMVRGAEYAEQCSWNDESLAIALAASSLVLRYMEMRKYLFGLAVLGMVRTECDQFKRFAESRGWSEEKIERIMGGNCD